MRKTFEETISALRELGLVFDDQSPRLPEALPHYDDEDPCGFSVFRMGIEDMDLSNLDMRRTFFSKSEISNCSFRRTDLEESNLYWNNFIGVNFSSANLSRSDLRASIYEKVDFSEADLSGSDLRQAEFNSCDFNGSAMAGAKLTKASGAAMPLSEKQRDEIDWQDTEGEEPGGG
ncbi:pentapeptide repeat-containing protein [Motilimonas sp. 1_MG-2023]|uniref:pentapeptide repeat-containing protein n=1 Tax=Motilimonas sp. 1_MG-2023 TaxID=3062672 RepID=UPI0026E44225|nr:pentapeptide repeat-containing protein [Motilimonas sp. 1_MG-2023]MDO6527482.1 pentapeptide repeat-containing protein [Motilimonas sp. 1_MG-2023]